MLRECEACGAFMLFAVTPQGRRQVVDYRPSAEGNILVLQPSGWGDLLSIVLSGDGLERARQRQMDLRLDHHATCPDADRFRSRV